MKTFAERLEYAIEFRNTTQAAVAKKAGVTRSAINQMKSGQTKGPAFNNVFAVADALRFKARWLLTGKGPMTWEEANRDSLDLTGLSDAEKSTITSVRDAFSNRQARPTAEN